MKWFDKTIPEAIQLSKERGSLFIVYIYGTDELSEQMTNSWDSSEVTQYMDSSQIVSIRIANSSEDCKFFSQIYPVCVVPSTFCIGEGGVPLEVIGGHVPGPDLVKKLKAVEQIHCAKKSGGAAATPTQVTREQITPVNATSTSSASPDTEAHMDTSEGAGGLPLDVKLQKAKELLEKKKQQKEQEEFEKQKLEEVERRKLGRGLTELKKYQQDQEMKEVRDQLKKDKEEERLAKEKIRAQIARDREERQARFQKEKQERETVMEEGKRAKLQEQQRLAAEQEAKKCENARIQVKLPDGSSVTETFPASEPLQTLHDFVSQRLGERVTLSTTFPRRRFTEDDMQSSFADLQLAPSAVVLALPDRDGSGANSQIVSSGGLSSWLLFPFTFLWGLIMSLLGTRSSQVPPPAPQTTPTDTPTESSQPHSRSARPKTAYQRRTTGNMRRMTDMRDDDEDMTTYNGNSTQQL